MATELATLAIAGVAVLGCIGSVLLLAFRVGKLTGVTEARIQQGESDRARIWESIGALVAKVDRHIETVHRWQHD
jgi:hypothetical protein